MAILTVSRRVETDQGQPTMAICVLNMTGPSLTVIVNVVWLCIYAVGRSLTESHRMAVSQLAKWIF